MQSWCLYLLTLLIFIHFGHSANSIFEDDFLSVFLETNDKADDKERQSKLRMLEITGVPLVVKENITEFAIRLGRYLNQPTDPSSLISAERRLQGTIYSRRPIIIGLAQYQTKLDWIRAYRKIFPLTLEKLNFSVPVSEYKKRVYIQEQLTAKNERYFYLARKLSRCYDFRHCFTNQGLAFVKKTTDPQDYPIAITSDDIIKILDYKNVVDV